MNDLITDSADIVEIDDIDADEEFSDLTATKEADASTMDFHVQMRGYTMRDFETMVVHAAAQQLTQGLNFKSLIEEKAFEIAGAKVNRQLSEALKDVMGITVTTRGKETITIGQMIGMEAKDYLTQKVDRKGNVISDAWSSSNHMPRIAFLVGEFVRQHFAKEIEDAMKALRAEISAAVSAQISDAVEAERKKIADAIGFEIQRKR